MFESKLLQERQSYLKTEHPGLLPASKPADLHIVGIDWTDEIIAELV
jgi:hypothetical protein